MTARAIATATVLALTAGILAACVPAPTLTVAASAVADTAESALEQQVGSRPDIDCGSGELELRKGMVVDCVLTDPATGDRFEAPVKIDAIDGDGYSITVNVAQEPMR